MDLGRANFPARLRIDGSLIGKAHLINGDLLRVADFHRTPGHGFWLSIPGGKTHALVHGGDEYLVPSDARGDLRLADLSKRQRSKVSARGAGSRYFERTLFQEAYGIDFATKYLHETYADDLEVVRFEALPWYENQRAWATLGAGLAVVAVGGVLHGEALDTRSQANASPWASERQRLNTQMASYEQGAWAAAGLGAAAALGSALWFALETPVAEERYRPPLRVQVGPGGVILEADFD
jgi:hypothetical protein